jgi:hypothetical protein
MRLTSACLRVLAYLHGPKTDVFGLFLHLTSCFLGLRVSFLGFLAFFSSCLSYVYSLSSQYLPLPSIIKRLCYFETTTYPFFPPFACQKWRKRCNVHANAGTKYFFSDFFYDNGKLMTESCFFQTPCKQLLGVLVKKSSIMHSFFTCLALFTRLRHESDDIFFFYTQCKHFLHVLVWKINVSCFFSSSSP